MPLIVTQYLDENQKLLSFIRLIINAVKINVSSDLRLANEAGKKIELDVKYFNQPASVEGFVCYFSIAEINRIMIIFTSNTSCIIYNNDSDLFPKIIAGFEKFNKETGDQFTFTIRAHDVQTIKS